MCFLGGDVVSRW